jgi:hypothetical protein
MRQKHPYTVVILLLTAVAITMLVGHARALAVPNMRRSIGIVSRFQGRTSYSVLPPSALYSSSPSTSDRENTGERKKPSIAVANRLLMNADRKRVLKKAATVMKDEDTGAMSTGTVNEKNAKSAAKSAARGSDSARGGSNSSNTKDKREGGGVKAKDRPFTLPPGAFKPKQSLGQNFLSDQNYVMKIIDSFKESADSKQGSRVVEVGPGPGALTRKLCVFCYASLLLFFLSSSLFVMSLSPSPSLRVSLSLMHLLLPACIL